MCATMRSHEVDPGYVSSRTLASPLAQSSVDSCSWVSLEPVLPYISTFHRAVPHSGEAFTGPTSNPDSEVGSERCSERFRIVAREVRRMTRATIQVPDEFVQAHEGRNAADENRLNRRRKSSVAVSKLLSMNRRKSAFKAGSSTEDYSRMSTRSKALGAAVAVFFLVATMTGVYLILHRLLFTAELPVECTSSLCQRLQEDIDRHLNYGADPCNDLYSFLCSSWQDKPQSGFVSDALNAFKDTISRALTSNEPPPPDIYGKHVLYKIFNACKQYMRSTEPGFEDSLEEVVNNLGLNRLLEAQRGNEVLGSILKAGLQVGIFTTFTIQVYSVGKITVLRLDLGDTIGGKLHAEYRQDTTSYKEDYNENAEVRDLVERILKFSGLNNSTLVDRLLEVDDHINKLLLQHAITEDKTVQVLGTILEKTTTAEMLQLLNTFLPPHLRMNKDSSVRVRGFEIIRNSHAVLRGDHVVTKRSYYSVNLLTGIMKYALAKVKDRPSLLLCLRSSRVALTHTLPYLLADISGYGHAADEAFDIAVSVRVSISEVDDPMLSVVLSHKEDLRDIVITTYRQSEIKDLQGVNYSSWDLQGGFLAVLLEASKKETIMLQGMQHRRMSEIYRQNQLSSNLAYVLSEQVLTVPTAYQGPPVAFLGSRDKLPFYVNYATLGALVAKEFVRALVYSVELSPASKAKMAETVKCLDRVMRTLELGNKSKNVVDKVPAVERLKSDMVIWSYSARALYHSMKRLLGNQGPKAFDRYWWTVQHYYFIRFCMLSCMSKDTDRYLDYFYERCAVPLFSNPDFAVHFNCSKRPNFVIPACTTG